MDNDDCRLVTEFTMKIFEGARTQSPDNFQEWALEQLKNIIPFDFATWGSGIILDDQIIIHAIHLHNQANQDMEHYLEYQSQDPLLAKMVETRQNVVTYDRYDVLPRESYIELPFYKEYCRVYGFEQTIGTMVPEPVSNLFSGLSICRSDYERHFTGREKSIKPAITLVLTEARCHNIFIHMIRTHDTSQYSAAICDLKGILREAETEFVELMVEEWCDWRGPQLNFIPEQVLDGRRLAYYKGEKVDVQVSVMHDLVLLQAQQKSPLEILTPAERKVTQLLLEGLSDKGIANHLKISPKTVGHHLQHIYKKLGVDNRKLVIARLSSDVVLTSAGENSSG